ncbi:cytochrome b/b6 domain-containing protein [Amylibacter sp. IMCC11727]|uniref:cytochrome b/b6 domain-containing protein n=1 Tax=Amylibacter sp. IMCC11727 TaxID=3039851 RepID=UPI00244E3B88|nr:cytochrome b/b6 domain-containing protein [Amylibacter sp. IMCC11727]WGI20286.1 cytochrome b/b6 domain-containing protein [Amylibacter sp. IMCC11727]
MTSRNTATHYGSITKTFHWLTALLIFTAFALGLYGTRGIDFSTEAGVSQAAFVFSMHKTVGITAFFVAVLRILWALTNTKPGLLNADHKLEAALAEIVHWLLYISLVIVPLSGWLHHAADTGFAPIYWPFGDSLPFVPKSEAVSAFFSGWHFVFTKVLALSIFLHIAGAIKHHVIDKDATLRRMLPGTPSLPAGIDTHHPKGPVFAAIVIYLVAMGAGSAIGLQAKHSETEAAELAEVSSDWQVQSGTLGLTVKQFGSDVSGTFKDWTAEISYDEASQTGDLVVTVSIGSLDLGGVTAQALGADYLNAAMFGTATYTATIAPTDTGHLATGTLNLHGVDAPLDLPFTLSITDGIATASGSTEIDRRTHKIGEVQPTENNLGFGVSVSFELTASQAE